MLTKELLEKVKELKPIDAIKALTNDEFARKVLEDQLQEATDLVDTFDNDHETAESGKVRREQVKLENIVENAPWSTSIDAYDEAIEKELVW